MSCAAIYWGVRPDAFARAFSVHGAVLPLQAIVLPESLGTLF